MTKYYRVRTQEQWEWLKNKLEIEDDLQVSIFPVTILYNDVFCGIYKYHDDPEPLIEVSQMMEESKMEDYVTIKGNDLFEIKNEAGHTAFTGRTMGTFYSDDYFTKLNIPKSLFYPKVPMAEAEKKEFDMAAGLSITPVEFLEEIESSCGDEYPCLFNKMFCGKTEKDNSKAQIEFIRAFADPSIIEIIPEKKWNVKVPVANGPTFYYKTGDGVDVCKPSPSMQNLETTRFTAEEIKYYHLDNDLFEKVEVSE